MASVKLEHIYKVYPNGTKAVNDISLDIKNGEFIVFVGPSGCGKSTTLRMIAGLEDITAGELYIDNQIVNDVEPKDRDIAMVFQNYALYPHMTVYENMAFGLKLRHVPDDVIQEKVLWAADILGIKEYLDRKPRAMSGGQRQRVALGRAILRDPKVMLLDEPLSNLDAKLRTQMRSEIAKLHQKLKTTFIYVTHDQVEAMTLGDRVVVMKQGRIQQVDTPKNLYDYPSNIFVAGFIGTPQMNFFDCTLKREGDEVTITLKDNDSSFKVPYNQLIKVNPDFLDGKKEIVLGIRCEHVKLASADDPLAIKVNISHFEELGSESLIYASLNNEEANSLTEKGQLIIKVPKLDNNINKDSVAYVTFDLDHTYFFDKKTEETITPRIPKENIFEASMDDDKLSLLGVNVLLPTALKGRGTHQGKLVIPTDAYYLSEDGSDVKVVNLEVINGTKLYHLELNNRIFFAILDSDHQVGETIKLSFDFSKIIFQEGETNVIEPLARFDDYQASFYNYQTVISKGDYPEFTQLRDDKIKAATDYFDAQIMLEDNDYEKKALALSALSEEDVNKIKSEAKEFYQTNLAKIKEVKSKAKAELTEKKADFKALKKKLIADNDALFKKKKEDEMREYQNFKANNKDKDALKRRSDEYHIFKDNFASEKENTLNLALNSATLDYESKVSAIKASTKREVTLLKKEMLERFKDTRKKLNGHKALTKEHNQRRRELLIEKKEQLERASLVFFFRFENDYYSLLTDIISNKLIQGLGTRVFSKEFKVEVPHDAYIITSDDNSLKGTVIEGLDYRSSYLAKVELSNQHLIYVSSDKPLKVGEKLSLTIDIAKVRITETGMNIRLY